MTSKKDQKEEFWHILPISDVFIKLNTHSSGLTIQESQKRLKEYGTNSLKSQQSNFIHKHHLTRINQYLCIILVTLIFISNLLE